MAKLKDKTKIGLWISKEDKDRAEEIIHSLGLTSSEVVRLLYKQIIFQRKLPFDLRVSQSSYLVSESVPVFQDIKPHQLIEIQRKHELDPMTDQIREALTKRSKTVE